MLISVAGERMPTSAANLCKVASSSRIGVFYGRLIESASSSWFTRVFPTYKKNPSISRSWSGDNKALRLWDGQGTVSSCFIPIRKINGIRGLSLVKYADREQLLCYKADQVLRRYLGCLGLVFSLFLFYRLYLLTSIDFIICVIRLLRVNRAWLSLISPKGGATPSPLPEWLSMPYLIRDPSLNFSYKPESLKNPLITGGYSIIDSSEKDVGSFSCLM